MTAEELADDIMRRCWEKDPLKIQQNPFRGLPEEITAAIREAEQVAYARGAAEEREKCAKSVKNIANQMFEKGGPYSGATVVVCEYIAEEIRARKDNAK